MKRIVESLPLSAEKDKPFHDQFYPVGGMSLRNREPICTFGEELVITDLVAYNKRQGGVSRDFLCLEKMY